MKIITQDSELEIGKSYAVARYPSDEADEPRLGEILRYEGEGCWSESVFIGNGKWMHEACDYPDGADGFVLQAA